MMESRPARLVDAVVVGQREAAPRHMEMVLEAPFAAEARPGQFVHVLCGEGPAGDGIHRFLRRPLSLFRIDRRRGRIAILYRLVGEGTRWLAARRPGNKVNLVGPLGNGFPLPESGAGAVPRHALLLGGGVGIPPLLPLAESLLERGLSVEVFLGARTADGLLAAEDFAALGVKVVVATDDGSCGFRGTVVGAARAEHGAGEPAVLYACGPEPLSRAVQALAAEWNVPAFLSLEERMACGVGACLGCPVPVAAADPGPTWPAPQQLARLYAAALPGSGRPCRYERACFEGPVFAAWRVLFQPSTAASGPPAGAGCALGG